MATFYNNLITRQKINEQIESSTSARARIRFNSFLIMNKIINNHARASK